MHCHLAKLNWNCFVIPLIIYLLIFYQINVIQKTWANYVAPYRLVFGNIWHSDLLLIRGCTYLLTLCLFQMIFTGAWATYVTYVYSWKYRIIDQSGRIVVFILWLVSEYLIFKVVVTPITIIEQNSSISYELMSKRKDITYFIIHFHCTFQSIIFQLYNKKK